MTTVPDKIYTLERDVNNAFKVSCWRKTLLTKERWYEHNETEYDFAWVHDTNGEDPNIGRLKSASIEEFNIKASALDLPCYIDTPIRLKPSEKYAEIVAFKHEYLLEMERIN